MVLIAWSDSLSVKVKEIDNQHKKLVDILNKLNEAMLARKAKDELGGILTELISYTQTHFLYEENLFQKYSYPDKVSHMEAHKNFVDKIQDVKSGFDSGNNFVSIELMSFLRKWIQEHIKGVDQKYSSFFNEKGLL